jgi:hypothetical protein
MDEEKELNDQFFEELKVLFAQEHDYTVEQTAQGLLVNLEETDENEGILPPLILDMGHPRNWWPQINL